MSTEFDRKKWVDAKKRNWPEGSLRRYIMLNFPGCRDLKEVLEMAIKEKRELEELKCKLRQVEGENEGVIRETD